MNVSNDSSLNIATTEGETLYFPLWHEDEIHERNESAEESTAFDSGIQKIENELDDESTTNVNGTNTVSLNNSTPEMQEIKIEPGEEILNNVDGTNTISVKSSAPVTQEIKIEPGEEIINNMDATNTIKQNAAALAAYLQRMAIKQDALATKHDNEAHERFTGLDSVRREIEVDPGEESTANMDDTSTISPNNSAPETQEIKIEPGEEILNNVDATNAIQLIATALATSLQSLATKQTTLATKGFTGLDSAGRGSEVQLDKKSTTSMSGTNTISHRSTPKSTQSNPTSPKSSQSAQAIIFHRGISIDEPVTYEDRDIIIKDGDLKINGVKFTVNNGTVYIYNGDLDIYGGTVTVNYGNIFIQGDINIINDEDGSLSIVGGFITVQNDVNIENGSIYVVNGDITVERDINVENGGIYGPTGSVIAKNVVHKGDESGCVLL